MGTFIRAVFTPFGEYEVCRQHFTGTKITYKFQIEKHYIFFVQAHKYTKNGFHKHSMTFMLKQI